MRTFCIFCFFGLMAGSIFAQSTHLPQAALADLKTRFPNVTGATWEKEQNRYEAEWTENGREIAVVYDTQGKYLMTEREIGLDELPAAVRKHLKRDHPNSVFHDAEQQSHANGRITYQVEMTAGCVTRAIGFDEKGKPIEEATDEGGGDDDAGEGGSDGSQED